jgi:hypothetical protein
MRDVMVITGAYAKASLFRKAKLRTSSGQLQSADDMPIRAASTGEIVCLSPGQSGLERGPFGRKRAVSARCALMLLSPPTPRVVQFAM